MGVDIGFRVKEEIRLNKGSSKYYDTRVLRYIRSKPWSGFKLARLNPEQQDRLLQPLRLRRPFTQPVKWDERSKTMVRDFVVPDAKKFLTAFGKSVDFWEFQTAES